MTHQVWFTPVAKEHLREIWEYTVAKWGTDQAEKYLLGIDEQLALIAENPEMGFDHPKITPGCRSYPYESHVIFYLLTPDEVQVVGVLHGRRDLPNRILELL